MKPSYSQLTAWCAMNGISLTRNKDGVEAVAYDRFGGIATRCETSSSVKALSAQSNDVARALEACDEIAEELLILKPSLAFKLNKNLQS